MTFGGLCRLDVRVWSRDGTGVLQVEHQFYSAVMVAALQSFNYCLLLHASSRGGHDDHKQAERQYSSTVEPNNKSHAALSVRPPVDSGGGSRVISIGAVTFCRDL